MVIKYKLIDTDVSKDVAKKIVDRQFTVERVKSNGGPSNDRKPPKKQKTTRDLLIEFMSEQRKFDIRIEKEVLNLGNRMNKQDKGLENIENRLDKHDKRFENIENRMNKQDTRLESIEHELSI